MPDGLIYAVAESIRGELLSETLARRGALPEEEAFDIFRQTAAGLQAAHAAGWIHGNFSPEAILLEPTAPGTLVKLIRFTHERFTEQQSDPPIQTEGIETMPVRSDSPATRPTSGATCIAWEPCSITSWPECHLRGGGGRGPGLDPFLPRSCAGSFPGRALSDGSGLPGRHSPASGTGGPPDSRADEERPAQPRAPRSCGCGPGCTFGRALAALGHAAAHARCIHPVLVGGIWGRGSSRARVHLGIAIHVFGSSAPSG